MNEAYSTDPVIQLNEVFPGDTNALDTLFGGRLMSIMDTAAGMAASKFAHRNFVTISVDALKFRRPAYQGKRHANRYRLSGDEKTCANNIYTHKAYEDTR